MNFLSKRQSLKRVSGNYTGAGSTVTTGNPSSSVSIQSQPDGIYVAFLSSGSVTIAANTTGTYNPASRIIKGNPNVQRTNFLVQAGGGSGSASAGGGAGGLVISTSPFPISPYSASVGGAAGDSSLSSPGLPGTITAKGGGPAGAPESNGNQGGCGGAGGTGGWSGTTGGAATQPSQNPGIANIQNYGGQGGNGFYYSGGAGGGTDPVNGTTPNTNTKATYYTDGRTTVGGKGVSVPAFPYPFSFPAPVVSGFGTSFPSQTYYGGGGGGGTGSDGWATNDGVYKPPHVEGGGGRADNVYGRAASTQDSQPGVNYLGGGGGGGSFPGPSGGKVGGSGVVLIKVHTP